MLNEIKIYCLASRRLTFAHGHNGQLALQMARPKALGQELLFDAIMNRQVQSVPLRLTVNQMNGLLANNGETF